MLTYLLGNYSFPDSLGDDLIVDVHDSKGKLCGRVVAQVANIAEDPVSIPKLMILTLIQIYIILVGLKMFLHAE